MSAEPEYEETKANVIANAELSNRLRANGDDTKKTFDHFKFVKLVSHTFLDSMERGVERDYQTWSYSMTSNKKETGNFATQNV